MTISLYSLQINEHGRKKPVVVTGPVGVGRITFTVEELMKHAVLSARVRPGVYDTADFLPMRTQDEVLYAVPDVFKPFLKENIGDQLALLMIDDLNTASDFVAGELMEFAKTGKLNGVELGENVVTVIDAGPDVDLEQNLFRDCQKVVFHPFDAHLFSAKCLVDFASLDTRHDMLIGGMATIDPHLERITHLVDALNGLEGGAFGAEAIARGIPPELTEALLKIKEVKSANPSPDERLDALCAAIDQCTQVPELPEAVKAKFEHHSPKPEDDFSR